MKQYGNKHARMNAFQFLIAGTIPLDLLTTGEVGEELRTFLTDDGAEHSSGDTRAMDLPCEMYMTDAAQVQEVESWFREVKTCAPGYKKPVTIVSFGEKDTVASANEIAECFPKSLRESGNERGSDGAKKLLITFSIFGVNKIV